MAEEAPGGAIAGSVEAPVARREGVAGSAESDPGQQLASADQPGALGEGRRLAGTE